MVALGFYIKLGLDFLFMVSSVVLFYVPIFSYMNGIKVYLVSITYSLGIVEITTSDADEVCGVIGITEICETFDRFIWAGAFFIIFLVISLIFAGLGVVSLFSPAFRIRKKIYRGKFYHIAYPLFYTFAFILYLVESQVFSLPNYSLGKDYKMRINFGLFLIIFMQVTSVLSLVSFCTVKTFCVLDLQENLLK